MGDQVQAVALTLDKSLPYSGLQFLFLPKEGNCTTYKLLSKLQFMFSLAQHQDSEAIEQLYKLSPNRDVRSVVPPNLMERGFDLPPGIGDSQV